MRRFRGGTRLVKAGVSTIAVLLLAQGAAQAQTYTQSPYLDEQVAAGDLPPVEERLPSNPLVVEPVDEIGTFGGVWRSGLRGGQDNAWIARTVAYDGLVRYDRNWDQIIPNVAASWEVSEDARRYTFELREGLKWNTGEPFTSEDIEFAIQLMQDDRYPGSAGFIDNPQNPVSIEIEDENTFTLVFEDPNGTVLDELSSVNGITIVSLSKSYCGQFYPEINPDAEALAEAEGFEGWAMLMENKCAWAIEQERWANPDLPMLNAWMLTQPLTGDATQVVFERNPYYFKVDPDGQQYPYIDRLEMRVSESLEELTLMALNGEIDYQDRHINTTINQPLFFDGQEQGDYRMGSNVLSNSNTMVLQLNFNHVDEAKRELFQNKDFRVGLSHAIDRQEIIDVVFTGQGEPFQVAPRPESPFYDEELAKQYTEFDPEASAAAFEAAGLTRNGDFYTMPDGSPLTITIDAIAAVRPEWVDMLELIQLQLAAGGIDVEINTIDRTLFYDKRPLGEYDAQIWQGDGGLDVVQEPRYYFPANGESVWAFRWQAWYNGTTPDIAEEPVDWAREQMDLYTALRQEGDAEARADLMNQILAITKEQFPVIGISLPGPGYYIAKNNLRNVADNMLHGWLFPTPAPYDPFQFYFE
jgi:peptide/nickel transport system substrate-binding protein